MILEMDAGNTCTKWRIRDEQGSIADSGSYPTSGALPAGWQGISRIRVGSVAGEAVRRALAAALYDALGVTPEFAQTAAYMAGVTNSYPDPARMGVDRWLALLAAHARNPGPVVVVDAGTAITVDALAADGRHAGGYIMPGLGLLAGALQSGTREVDFDPAAPAASLEPGIGTGQSVGHGVLLMGVAAIQRAVQECQGVVGDDATVLLCGGDVAIMRSQLPVAWCHEPNLVLDGLALALP